MSDNATIGLKRPAKQTSRIIPRTAPPAGVPTKINGYQCARCGTEHNSPRDADECCPRISGREQFFGGDD